MRKTLSSPTRIIATTTKVAATAAAALALAFAGATAALAAPATLAADVTVGHVDIVELECTAGALELGSHIEDRHVEQGDIGAERFVFSESNSNGRVTSTATGYTIAGDAAAEVDIANLGFAYTTDGSTCLSGVTVKITSPDGKVTFNGSETVRITPGQHLHGQWVFTPITAGDKTFTVTFNATELGESITPVNVAFTA